jgi:ATP-dependent exoDNAse (exonuclease V) alpha subunit
LHLDQGIAVTGHASQAKTVDQVIASVPVRSFSQANEAQFYVTMSRARWAMYVFTDSKVALRDAVTRPSKRLSSLGAPRPGQSEQNLKIELALQGAEPKKQEPEVAYER